MSFLVGAAILIAACTKENSDVRLDPKLSTSQVMNVKADAATVVGFVVASGSGFSERGVCYNTDPQPTVANNKVVFDSVSNKATFTVELNGLDYTTKYYVRAYATGENGTIYGEEMSFTTPVALPALTTAEITSVLANTAMGGGNVTDWGGGDVTARGVCFGMEANPTVANDTTVDGNGTGEFTSMLSGLRGKTLYYARAYATNSAGTGYGPEVSFTTLPDVPTVSTTAVTGVTKTEAVSGGMVSYNGGEAVTQRGLVWGMSENPTINDNVIVDNEADTGSYVSNLSGLEKNTTYHVRAFATNTIGTGYGEDISFTTKSDIVTLVIAGDYQGWDPAGAEDSLMNTLDNPSIVQGYAYIPNTNGFKFVSNRDWNIGANYGAGAAAGELSTDPGADNISVSEPGYYLFKIDIENLTYTALKTTWGVIGSATADGWNSGQPMTYSEVFKRWFATIPLTADEFKFRANNSWDAPNPNYGDDGQDGVLEEGGANIPVGTAGTYSIMMDLSQPNHYTYALTTWSIFGSSTPGGDWSTDVDLTPHADNTWTVTADLLQGEFKFRANHGWDYNLGGSPDALSWGGDNIKIDADGNYTITLDLVNGTYTIE